MSPCLCIDLSNTLETASLSGIQRVTLELGRALGDAVDVVALDGRSGRFVRLHPAQRRRLEQLRGGENRRGVAQRLDSKIVRSAPAMRPQFRSDAASLLLDIEASWHAPMLRAELLPRWAGSTAALIHDVLPLTNPEWFPVESVARFRQWFEAHVAANSTLLAVSDASADAVAALGASRPTTIRIGQTNTPPPSQGNGVLMVGTIEPRKGHAVILDALDLLGDEAPVVDVVGKAGWNTDDVISRLERHPNIRWHKSISDADLETLWQLSGLLLQPSLGEGFGLPIIEALQRRVAVMSSDIPVMREVGRGESTLIELEASAWAEALASYVADPVGWTRPKRLEWPTWNDSAVDALDALTTAGAWPSAPSASK